MSHASFPQRRVPGPKSSYYRRGIVRRLLAALYSDDVELMQCAAPTVQLIDIDASAILNACRYHCWFPDTKLKDPQGPALGYSAC